MTVDLVTIPDIAILSTGTWNLSTGQVTITPEDLSDAVAASYDPGFNVPRGKQGHVGEVPEPINRTLDGSEPAIGRFENLKLSEDRQWVIGDYVDVPRDFAAELPSKFPNRSFEGWADVTSPATGITYRTVITAVALLGVAFPAISVLPDLTSEQVGNALAASGGRPFRATSVAGDGVPRSMQAQINEEDIVRAFQVQVGEPSQLWIRTQLRDPDEFVCDTWDCSQIYKVPYTISGATIEFGAPVEQSLTPVDSSAQAASGRFVRAFAARSESRPNTHQEDDMDPKAMRERFGLGPDATDEELDAAMTRASELLTAANDTGEEDPDEVDADLDEEDPAPEANALAAQLQAAGLTVIAPTELAKLQRQAAQGAKARTAQVNAERDAEVASWKAHGRISESERPHFAKLAAKDLAATRDLVMATRPKGTVPVTGEAGHGQDVEATGGDLAAAMAFHRGNGRSNAKGA